MSERGSGTVLALALIGVLLALVAGIGVVVDAHRSVIRVQSVADLAALAASDIDRGVAVGRPCRDARGIVRQHGLHPAFCAVEDGRARVQVRGSVWGVPVVREAVAATPGGGVWPEG